MARRISVDWRPAPHRTALGHRRDALEPVSPQLTFAFHVTGRKLNSASSANSFPDQLYDAAFLTTAPDRHPLNADTR
ncbi:hypothetical protein ABF87_13080 [Nitrosomonas sp. JL21]|nr:hypothetical protein [Nitrosomonas sp.]MXS78869.1 hypothetical protein [Nitrosomonas sp. JL21]